VKFAPPIGAVNSTSAVTNRVRAARAARERVHNIVKLGRRGSERWVDGWLGATRRRDWFVIDVVVEEVVERGVYSDRGRAVLCVMLIDDVAGRVLLSRSGSGCGRLQGRWRLPDLR
jgi:hypothetical protein